MSFLPESFSPGAVATALGGIAALGAVAMLVRAWLRRRREREITRLQAELEILEAQYPGGREAASRHLQRARELMEKIRDE